MLDDKVCDNNESGLFKITRSFCNFVLCSACYGGGWVGPGRLWQFGRVTKPSVRCGQQLNRDMPVDHLHGQAGEHEGALVLSGISW